VGVTEVGLGDGRREALTFLFTDIEGSTRLLSELGDAFEDALLTHHAILREQIAARGGWVRRTEGDSFFATFSSAGDALQAAAGIQRALQSATWPQGGEVRVRIGVHAGEATARDGDYVGIEVHRAARVMAVGWGGQVLVSRTAAELAGALPTDVHLRDLGDHRLKDLSEPERLFQLDLDGLPTEFPTIRSLDAVPNNLPTQVTPFIGRDDELASVLDRMRTARAVTLTGPGGTGKTRLALQAAAAAAQDFPGGVFFVPLGAIVNADLLMSSVAHSLQLRAVGDQSPSELVTDYLADRTALLVLDNLEQILDSSPQIAKLLADAPQLTVLTTSRAPLRIYGEHEYRVAPMVVPDQGVSVPSASGTEAVELFVARAQAVSPGFELDAGNVGDVVSIVRRLDGLPLAVELAAARVRLLSVASIASRLDDCFALLSSGERDRPDRQRTIEGAIRWSHDLLSAPAQQLFADLAVFRGGADYDAIERVCGDGLEGDLLDALGELVDHSLVQRRPGATVERFAMLALIHEFAVARLVESGDAASVRDRHLDLMLERAEAAAPHLTGVEPGDWLDRLEVDHDNHRAAIDRALTSGRTAEVLRLVAALWRMWQIRGHLVEATDRIDAALSAAGAQDHTAELAEAEEAAGGVAYWRGQVEATLAHYERALELREKLDDPTATARAHYNLGFGHLPESVAGRVSFERALQLFEGLEDSAGVASAHWGLTVAAYGRGDGRAALSHGTQALEGFQEQGRQFDVGWALHMVGLAHYLLGEFDQAAERFRAATDIFRQIDDRSGQVLMIWDFGILAEARGDDERALRLFGASKRLAAETGASVLDPQLERLERLRDADAAAGPDRAAEFRAEGAEWTVEEAFSYALASTESPAPRHG